MWSGVGQGGVDRAGYFWYSGSCRLKIYGMFGYDKTTTPSLNDSSFNSTLP